MYLYITWIDYFDGDNPLNFLFAINHVLIFPFLMGSRAAIAT